MAKKRSFKEIEDGVSELPEVFSKYRGWSVWIEKDETHKYVITAVRENSDGYEIGRVEINGDEIDEDEDVETVVSNKIDEEEERLEEKKNWNENYPHIMGLANDPDWFDS